MAEFVVIYDSAAGSFISKQLGSAHLADLAVVSGKLAAGSVASGAVASGVLGGVHFRNQSILSAAIGANVLATPHFVNQGILSASIASGIVGGPLLQDWGLVSGKVASGAIQPDNFSFLAGMISRPTPYGCVLDLDFAEGLGTKAYDKSGNNNDGDLVGGPTWTDDALMGRCLSFDGLNDYVDAGNGASLNPNAITIEAWFKLNAVGVNYVLMSRQSGGLTYSLWIASDNTLRFVISSDGATWGGSIIGSPSLSTGIWYHAVATYDKVNLKLYLNGVSDATPVAFTLSMFQGTVTNLIGWDGSTTYFNGLIDEVRIYNRALSADEIRGRYIQGLTKLGKIQGSFRLFTSGWAQKVWFDPETADFQAVSGAVRTSGLLYAGTSQVQLTNAAGFIISGGIASGAIGPHIAAQGVLSAHIGASVLATPHFANQGILSASLAAGAIGGAHLNASDVWPGRVFSGAITLSGFVDPFTVWIRSGQGGIRIFDPVGGDATYLPGGDANASFQKSVLIKTSLGVGVAVPAVSGRINVGERVDSVDISAHTHGAGAGDAPNILSASIASGSIGPHLAAQGVLSAHIGANVLATPHFANAGILSASIASGIIGFVHLAALPPSAQDFWFGGTGDFTDAPNAWPYEWRRSQQPQASTHRNYISLVSGHPYTQVLLEGTLQANISGHSEVGLFSGDLVTASQTINSGSTPLVYISGVIGTLASGPIFSQWGTLTPLVGQSVFCGARRGATSAAITFTARAWIR